MITESRSIALRSTWFQAVIIESREFQAQRLIRELQNFLGPKQIYLPAYQP